MQIVIDTRCCPCRTLNDECGISENECYADDIDATCPLIGNGGVKLPKGHGRLKDVDFFIQKVNADRSHSIYVYSWTANDVLKALDKSYAPTIIEAERGDNE